MFAKRFAESEQEFRKFWIIDSISPTWSSNVWFSNNTLAEALAEMEKTVNLRPNRPTIGLLATPSKSAGPKHGYDKVGEIDSGSSDRRNGEILLFGLCERLATSRRSRGCNGERVMNGSSATALRFSWIRFIIAPWHRVAEPRTIYGVGIGGVDLDCSRNSLSAPAKSSQGQEGVCQGGMRASTKEESSSIAFSAAR